MLQWVTARLAPPGGKKIALGWRRGGGTTENFMKFFSYSPIIQYDMSEPMLLMESNRARPNITAPPEPVQQIMLFTENSIFVYIYIRR